MSDQEEVQRLFARLAEGDLRARADLVEQHQGLVAYLARRFTGRGEPLEDLRQVGNLGLIKAIDRFDPDRGVQFSTYATATIVGELKRHLRDKAWGLKVPRGIKQASLELARLEQELSQTLGRSPTVAELADASDLTVEQVLEALDAGRSYSLASLDVPASPDSSRPLIEDLPSTDDLMGLAERLATVTDAIGALPERERTILYLRFYEDLTQTEIAAKVGISQMHVSRLLSRALDSIRRWVDGER